MPGRGSRQLIRDSRISYVCLHTFGDLFALVDLGNLFVEELVALLADLNDLAPFQTPSCRFVAKSASCFSVKRYVQELPVTDSSTFCEICAAVLYLVRVSGLLRV